MIQHLADLIKLTRGQKRKKISVAAAHDKDVLQAVVQAYQKGIADAVLVGKKYIIETYLEEMDCEPGLFEIVEADTDDQCAAEAVRIVREEKAQFLMKGILGTADLMKAVVDKKTGIRGKRLMSHVMFFEVPSYSKVLCLTDGGMCTFPDLGQKVEILKNAAETLQRLGYDEIYTACICGAEGVNSKIVSTTDARDLSAMTECWTPYHMKVYGPVGLDMAISKRSCEHKHYMEQGAGEADILLVPTYEVGNGIGKAMIYFGGAKNAGIIVGAQVPIILVSRSDTAESKLTSIALASLVS